MEDGNQSSFGTVQGEIHAIHEGMKRDKALTKIKEDKLEQEVENEETLISAVEVIAAETGVQLGEQSISAVHRVGRKGTTSTCHC